MINDEKPVDLTLQKKINKLVRKTLQDAMGAINFTDKVVPVVDVDDGETYYTIERNSGLKRHHVLTIDDALIVCAKLFSDNGLPNRSKFYRKISRMVHYALYELESRELLENEVSVWIAKVGIRDEE